MTTVAARGSGAWRLWALVPLLVLIAIVALFAATGSSLTDLLGRTPPPADQFDVRRVELEPGEIRVLVTNPQADDLTIATVTVDDAIVPYTVDGDSTLGRLRSATIGIPYDWVPDEPLLIGVTSSSGIQTTHEVAAAVETPTPSPQGISRLRPRRAARRRCPGRARDALAALTAAGETRVARSVHGADRRAALVPRARGAVRGVRAASGAALGARRGGRRPARVRRLLPHAHVSLAQARRAGDARRDRHRPAQLRGRARDRDVVRVRRARARVVPDHRLHDPQRHRRPRDRNSRDRGAPRCRSAGLPCWS